MVLPGAGLAKRFGSDQNKIWATLAGRSVLEWTLQAFQDHAGVDSITLVGSADDLARLREIASGFAKAQTVVEGGATRAASVRNGLNAVPADSDLILVHDAARPLISSSVIDRVIEATARVGCAVPGLPLSDTVKRVDAGGLVRATIPRTLTKAGEMLAGLTTVQTPQGARTLLLKQAYARYDWAQGEPTDEASLIEALGEPVQVVAGEAINIKITRPEDIQMAERLGAELFAASGAYGLTTEATGLNADTTQTAAPGDAKQTNTLQSASASSSFPEYRTGFGYDVHAFAGVHANRRLFLGGVEIPHDRGLDGHSDADVLLHAVCDALLGAASLGDIGILFPNTDDTYKGIASLKLLQICAQRLNEAGWRVVNVDATVVAEAPKLMPHRVTMQQTMASCLGIEADRISVKATTSEQLGFIGRREGIEASAIATVVRSS